MSTGCVVLGSDTAPVREVMNGENGIVVPFFDVEQWSDRILHVLGHPERFKNVRRAAREFVKENFCADKLSVPRMLSLLRHDLAGR